MICGSCALSAVPLSLATTEESLSVTPPASVCPTAKPVFAQGAVTFAQPLPNVPVIPIPNGTETSTVSVTGVPEVPRYEIVSLDVVWLVNTHSISIFPDSEVAEFGSTGWPFWVIRVVTDNGMLPVYWPTEATRFWTWGVWLLTS